MHKKQLVQARLRSMKDSWWRQKADELQLAADRKVFFRGLKAVFGPKSTGSTPIYSSDGTRVKKLRMAPKRYKRISMAHDFTPHQREIIKEVGVQCNSLCSLQRHAIIMLQSSSKPCSLQMLQHKRKFIQSTQKQSHYTPKPQAYRCAFNSA